jgi:hypothetical protein
MNEPEDQERKQALDLALKSLREKMNKGASGLLYKLEGHTAVPCDDFIEWALAYEDRGRIVQQDQIGDYWVSTVFLGLNTRMFSGLPALFESMVFINNKSSESERYSTWDEALAGHLRICAALRESG